GHAAAGRRLAGALRPASGRALPAEAPSRGPPRACEGWGGRGVSSGRARHALPCPARRPPRRRPGRPRRRCRPRVVRRGRNRAPVPRAGRGLRPGVAGAGRRARPAGRGLAALADPAGPAAARTARDGAEQGGAGGGAGAARAAGRRLRAVDGARPRAGAVALSRRAVGTGRRAPVLL
ncbi:MAG: FIG00800187: hypothetical protein, partial [uncultured Blastococcus sp.]